MSKKYLVNIGPKTFRFPPDFSFFTFRSGLAGLLDFTNRITPLLWQIFLLFLFPSFYFLDVNGPGASYLIWLYGFVVMLLFLQILKKLISKGDYLPTVPYDILLLFFVSLTTIAMFVNLYVLKGQFSIWGGPPLRLISTVSLIAFWFVYYLSNIYNQSQYRWSRVVKLLTASMLITVVFNIFTGASYSDGILLPVVLLAPAYLWLALTAKKHRWLFVLSLLVSGVMLVEFKNPVIVLSTLFAMLVPSVMIIFKYRKNLKQLLVQVSSDVDKVIERKLSIGGFLSHNSEIIYLLLFLIMLVVGFTWIRTDNSINVLQDLEKGFAILKQNITLPSLLIGKSLIQTDGSLLIQFVSAYGLLGTLILGAFIIMMLIWIIRQAVSGKFKFDYGFFMFLISVISANLLFFTLAKATELQLIFLTVIISIAAAIKNATDIKKPVELSSEIQEFEKVKSPLTRRILGILQAVSALALVAGFMFFLILLQTIRTAIS
jgi:hypothetical protein